MFFFGVPLMTVLSVPTTVLLFGTHAIGLPGAYRRR